jgi:hypothetical protein
VDLFCRTFVSGQGTEESNRQDSYPEITRMGDVIKVGVLVWRAGRIATNSHSGPRFYYES